MKKKLLFTLISMFLYSTSGAVESVIEYFGCSVKGTNLGCGGTAECPPGFKIKSAKAGCNLESPTVRKSFVDSLADNQLSVQKRSNTLKHGRCIVGSSKAASGSRTLRVAGLSSISYSCKEQDDNGGDCGVRGQLVCESTPSKLIGNNEHAYEKMISKISIHKNYAIVEVSPSIDNLKKCSHPKANKLLKLNFRGEGSQYIMSTLRSLYMLRTAKVNFVLDKCSSYGNKNIPSILGVNSK